MSNILLSSIAIMAKNRVIGKDGTMPWHLPEDLKHFKRTTMGKPIIMGRKSYDSLGKPLPGRPNIVVSRSYRDMKEQEPTDHFEGMESVGPVVGEQNADGPFLYASIEEGIEAAKEIARHENLDEIFITGGGEIYKQTLPYTDHLYLTLIDRDYDGDTYFPEFDWDEWKIASEKHLEGDPALTFYTLERKN